MGASRRPAEVFPLGAFLKEELDARGWSQAELAEIIGRTPGVVNELISGKRSVNVDLAQALGAAFGTSAEFWLNLENAYQLWRSNGTDSGTIARKGRLHAKVPIRELVRRGWIEPSDNIDVLERRVLDFLGTSSLDEDPPLLVAARKSTSYSSPSTPAQVAWFCRAERLARGVSSGKFDRSRFNQIIDRLRPLRSAPLETRHVARVLAEGGVRLVIVEPLAGCKIDGACIWTPEGPIVALSLRYDRIDNFWFVLMHELGHVAQRQPSFDTEIDVSGPPDKKPPAERDADAFATQHLVPQDQLEDFIARVGPLYSESRIEGFAYKLGVHPALVIGQLQHRGELKYSKFRRALEPVRSTLVSSTLTDGWGAVLPANL